MFVKVMFCVNYIIKYICVYAYNICIHIGCTNKFEIVSMLESISHHFDLMKTLLDENIVLTNQV